MRQIKCANPACRYYLPIGTQDMVTLYDLGLYPRRCSCGAINILDTEYKREVVLNGVKASKEVPSQRKPLFPIEHYRQILGRIVQDNPHLFTRRP